MTTGTVALGSIPSDSNQFVQTVQSNLVGGLAQGVSTYGANLQDAFMTAIGKGRTGGTAESQYLGFLAKSGVPEAAAADMAQYAGTSAGASPQQLQQMMSLINGTYRPSPSSRRLSAAAQRQQAPRHRVRCPGGERRAYRGKPAPARSG